MFSRAGFHGNKWNHFKLEGGYLWETAHIASGITAFRQPKNGAACRISRSAKDTEEILKSNEMRGCREYKGLRTPHKNKLGSYTPNLVYYNLITMMLNKVIRKPWKKEVKQ